MADPLRGARGWRRHKRSFPVVPALLPPDREGRARRLGYAALSLPLGTVYGALFVCLVVAVPAGLVLVGFLVFPAALALARALCGIERRLARTMLHVEVEDVVRLRHLPGGAVRRLRGLLTASSTWRAVAWLGIRVLFTAAVLATVLLAAGIAILVLDALPRPRFDHLPSLGIVVLLLVPALAVVVVHLVDLEVRIVAAIAPLLLGASPQEQMEALRQTSLRLAERNSVARDLHDTIGHTLTASLLQATAARRSLTGDTDRPTDLAFAEQALAHIEDNTRAALAELDRALAVLGDRRGTDSRELFELPSPDLADVENLATGLRDGGLPVTVRVNVLPEQVPAHLSRLAYRIVQEGTTNVLRHADCPPTLVEVDRRDDHLLVRVHNARSGRTGPRPGPGGGHGITGLQERAMAVGGRVTARPADDGGFELCATLPLRGPE